MNKLKHTKGRWKLWGDGDLYVSVSKGVANAQDICTLPLPSYASDVDVLNANARLICCSPDFLEDKIKDFNEIGKWLSAALSDANVCAEMKKDINNWFERFDTFEKATGFKIGDIGE